MLDPPPFAKSKSALEGALRGYKDINLRAMQRLAPEGFWRPTLARITCTMRSFAVYWPTPPWTRSGRCESSNFVTRPPDHPVLVTMPESEYLARIHRAG